MVNPSSVPLSQPLVVGQRDKPAPSGTPPGTTSGTGSLKALARLVLERDKPVGQERDSAPQPCPSAPAASVPAGQTWDGDLAERAAIVEHDAGIPRAWAEGFARLAEMPCPTNIPPRRWRRFVDDAGRFLDRGWGAKAASLGWGATDLLGCDRHRPWQRIDVQGLLWLLDGAEVVALTEATATTRNSDGARLTFRRVTDPNRVGTCLAWELCR